MSKRDFGGLGDGSMPGGRDQGIGPTGPDDEPGEASRKGSDMSGAPAPDPRVKEGTRVDETPSPNDNR